MKIYQIALIAPFAFGLTFGLSYDLSYAAAPAKNTKSTGSAASPKKNGAPKGTTTPANRIGDNPTDPAKLSGNNWVGILPDNSKTPGMINPCIHAEQICPAPGCIPGKTCPTTKNRRNGTTQKDHNQVLQLYIAETRYGVEYSNVLTQNVKPNEGHQEIDHLISLEVGGADDVENIWPEPFQDQSGGAGDKDQIEHHSKPEMCAMLYDTNGKTSPAMSAKANEYLALMQRLIAAGFTMKGSTITGPKVSWYSLYFSEVFPKTILNPNNKDGSRVVKPGETITYWDYMQAHKQDILNLPEPSILPPDPQDPSTKNCKPPQIK